MKHIYRYNSQMIAIAFICIFLTSCKKLVEIDPPAASLTTQSAFNDDNATIALMTGHYSELSNRSGSGTFLGISGLAALSADELTLWSGAADKLSTAIYSNDLYGGPTPPDEYPVVLYWPYYQLYECNTVIENINASTGLSASVKKQILGEAKFMRACYFFYLVNLYGDIPMPLSTDIKINSSLSRTPKDQVYQQIIADLKEAENLLSSDYLDAGLRKYLTNVERVRPTKWAALALLARVYLYTKDYGNAEATASTLINNGALFNLTDLNDVFKANSREAIWQLQGVQPDRNTWDGNLFILNSTGPDEYKPFYLSETLLNAFEPGDGRKTDGNWVNSVTTITGETYYFPFKYKLPYPSNPGQEYAIVFRLGEQYLIRAEARAKLGNISGARDDLFAIRRRAGLADGTLTANDQASLMTAVMHERQVELFTEMGHRWLDLKRNGTIDAVMSVEAPKKGGSWQSTDALYPLPFDDIQRDKNLTQNPGY
jgi:hypothetical protein